MWGKKAKAGGGGTDVAWGSIPPVAPPQLRILSTAYHHLPLRLKCSVLKTKMCQEMYPKVPKSTQKYQKVLKSTQLSAAHGPNTTTCLFCQSRLKFIMLLCTAIYWPANKDTLELCCAKEHFLLDWNWWIYSSDPCTCMFGISATENYFSTLLTLALCWWCDFALCWFAMPEQLKQIDRVASRVCIASHALQWV